MNTLLQDLRYATRILLKQPGFTVIAVLTLALGIGANTAIFSVVNAVLLRPLPYPQPERIVYLNEIANGVDTSLSLPDYLDWQKDAKSFQHLAITRTLESRNLSGIAGREPERISCAYVTANFFNVIGLNPQLGRTFTEDEDKPGAPALVVLSDRLWDRAFNRDPQIIGRVLNFHGRAIHRHRYHAARNGFAAWDGRLVLASCVAAPIPDGRTAPIILVFLVGAG